MKDAMTFTYLISEIIPKNTRFSCANWSRDDSASVSTTKRSTGTPTSLSLTAKVDVIVALEYVKSYQCG